MSLNERLKFAEMKARHSHALLPWYKKWWGILSLIAAGLIFIILIASAAYVVNRVQQIISGQASAMNEEQLQIYLQKVNGDSTNYSVGTSTPKVTIVEFGDFACPYTEQAYSVVNQLAQSYKDKIKIVWRDYLRNLDSVDLAMTARCAGEQNKFWPMHDALFANQAALSVNDDARPGKLVALAQNLGLNVDQFTACLTSQKYLDQIKKDYDDGNALQIIGTPTWFVNNHTFSGYIPFDKFNSLIGGLLVK
ncbi:MAG: thioredoxin domain-containing protein [Patescibacteria group bacterium]|jgi:protein-disulfide isomerase